MVRVHDLERSLQFYKDALGLSTVHVNRTLQEIRGAGLIELRRGRLVALDWEGLCEAGEFEQTYLHRQRTEAV